MTMRSLLPASSIPGLAGNHWSAKVIIVYLLTIGVLSLVSCLFIGVDLTISVDPYVPN
ncbi:MAG: hypothetical protein ACI90A_000619 [Shewanella sp.]|jgi:hypothetical protein